MTVSLKVPNMACSACADKITKAVQALDPGATVQADTKTKLVNIEAQASETAVREAIIAAGCAIAE